MKKYQIQTSPFLVPTTDGKIIKEHFGLASIENPNISIAHMVAPAGWSEPFQTPDFEEYTFILKGKKQFNINGDTIILSEGESIKIQKNVRVQYSNPFLAACEYLSICTPAFSADSVNREER